MPKFQLENNGFNRYYAINPKGVPIWESEHAAGTCESEAWNDFLEWCGSGDHYGIDDYETASASDYEDSIEEAMQRIGWSMIECEPTPERGEG